MPYIYMHECMYICMYVCRFREIHELPFDDKAHSHFGYSRSDDGDANLPFALVSLAMRTQIWR